MRVSITISLSDNEEHQMNKRTKKLHDRSSKTAKSKDLNYHEESETKEESSQSEEESRKEDKGIKDDNEDKMYGYIKNHMKTVKNKQARTRERKSEQKAGSQKPGKVKPSVKVVKS
ncbi:hypothetical protein Tco_0269316 [Tanacetum coccineum]